MSEAIEMPAGEEIVKLFADIISAGRKHVDVANNRDRPGPEREKAFARLAAALDALEKRS